MTEKYVYRFLMIALSIVLLSLLATASAQEHDDITSREVFVNGLVGNYNRNHALKPWKEYAESLRKSGDQKYKKKRYREAGLDYDNAWPNLPSPYPFIMLGDMFFRSRVADTKTGHAHAENNNYCWRKVEFVRYGSETLDWKYGVGFELAKNPSFSDFIKSPIFEKSQKSAVCLRELISKYSVQNAPMCVDVKEVGLCLGKPLIK